MRREGVVYISPSIHNTDEKVVEVRHLVHIYRPLCFRQVLKWSGAGLDGWDGAVGGG